METSSTSFLRLLRDISEAVRHRKESATDYDNLLRMIFQERGIHDTSQADPEVLSEVEVEHLPILKAEKVFGREGPDMWYLLSKCVNPFEKRLKISAIPVLGSCGIGKTTFAQVFYEDKLVQEHFELRVWVTVGGQEFRLHHAAQEILKSALGMSCSPDDLDEMVRDTLQWRRCLIVLDGIESMTEDCWLHMITYWFDFVDVGSKVLITTSSKDVANLVADEPLELKPLLPYGGWSLCGYLAFDSSEIVKDMSRHVVKNLRALSGYIPLLLKLVGSMMRYDDKLRNLLSSVDLSDVIFLPTTDASVAILLSVWALPPHLRQCLAFCALFPEGYALNREKITRMWLAHGLVMPSPRNKSLHDTADSYIHQLLCRSFFTDMARNEYGDITEFRMHGLIHTVMQDVASIVWNGKLGVIGSISEDADQLSLHSEFAGKHIPGHMRNLIFSFSLYSDASSLDHSLLDFQVLQSLDLSCSGIRNLSDDICALRELRYLNLSCTLIERLPESITDLSHLQTLDLSWCYHLKVLPKKMSDLTHMTHLDLHLCESLSYLPSDIGFLVSLSSMPLFVLGKDHDCARLGELGLLNQLSGRLEIRNLENVKEISEARRAKLDQKNLHYLGLFWSQNAEDCFQVLKLLQPNPHLKVLDLTGYMGFIFPQWISLINGLIKISITNSGCKELPSLGQLPFLKELQLKGMTNLERIGPELYGDGVADAFFPSLEQLELYDLPRLLEWSGPTLPRFSSAVLPSASPRKLSLSNLFRPLPSGATASGASGGSAIHVCGRLRTLTIEGCPKLASLPSLPTLPDLTIWHSNKSILSSLTSFTSLSSLLINDVELEVAFQDLCMLHSLKKLILCNIKNEYIRGHLHERRAFALEHLGILHCDEFAELDLHNLTSLRKLHIVDCRNLAYIWMSRREDTPLMELVVEDCPRALGFMYSHKLHSLRKLVVKNCVHFSIYYSGEYKMLEKLEYLFISGCRVLESELQVFFPSSISRVPCIIMGDRMANYKDMQDLRYGHGPQSDSKTGTMETMGSHMSKSPVKTSAENSINNLQFTTELNTYQAACKLDADLQAFDATLQERTSKVINALASGVEVRALSFDSLREVTECLLEMNQEVVKVISVCMIDIWKNQDLFKLVEEYFEKPPKILDFYTSLEKCLKSASSSQLLIHVALRQFEEEDELERNERYSKTLNELKNFKDFGDQFTKDFFQIFESVYRQQILMLERLQSIKKKLDKKLKSIRAWRKVSSVIFAATFAAVLICSVVAASLATPLVAAALAAATSIPLGSNGRWIDSLHKNYENAVKGQGNIANYMNVGSYTTIKDLDHIGVLVHRLEIEIESRADFTINEDALKLAAEEIKEKLVVFMKSTEELNEQVDKCSRDIRRARTVILQRIIKHPGN